MSSHRSSEARLDPVLEKQLDWFRSAVKHRSEQVMEGRPAWVDQMPWCAPLALGSNWSGADARAGFLSLLVHGVLGTLVLAAASLPPVQRTATQVVTLIAPDLRSYTQSQREAPGGGGGGRQQLDASRGKLPKPAPRQFTPPRVDSMEARLQVAPSIISPPEAFEFENYGDPLSRFVVPSNGRGFLGGVGGGGDAGVGQYRGPGFGPGDKPGFTGGVYRIGGAVSAPVPIFRPEPEYSEEARKAKWQGTMILSAIINEQGVPVSLEVSRSLGLGLDQKAMEAVSHWRFRPGLKDGKPVPVIALIEVNFRLL